MRHGEDRRAWICVDRNDEFDRRHAFQVLRSAGYPERKVKLWAHLLARFTHLTRLRQPAAVDNWAAPRDLGAEKA